MITNKDLPCSIGNYTQSFIITCKGKGYEKQYIYMCIYISVYICVCVCVCVYIYIYSIAESLCRIPETNTTF